MSEKSLLEKMCPRTREKCYGENCAFWAGSYEFEGDTFSGCVDAMDAAFAAVYVKTPEYKDTLEGWKRDKLLKKRFAVPGGQEVG